MNNSEGQAISSIEPLPFMVLKVESSFIESLGHFIVPHKFQEVPY